MTKNRTSKYLNNIIEQIIDREKRHKLYKVLTHPPLIELNSFIPYLKYTRRQKPRWLFSHY